jgi:hypothetical protein
MKFGRLKPMDAVTTGNIKVSGGHRALAILKDLRAC